jgi:hypothetical protein
MSPDGDNRVFLALLFEFESQDVCVAFADNIISGIRSPSRAVTSRR